MIPRTLFSAEHELFRDQVKRFIANEIMPYHEQWERDGIVPRSLWHKAGEAGLLCTEVPDEYGGGGGDFLFGAIMVEEMARAGATGPTFYLHSEIVAPYLVHYGTEEQKRRWLPAMSTGEVVVALGMSEPGGGSDVAGMRTTALRDGDDYVINGQKVFITAGFNADLIVLACKTDPKAGAKRRQPDPRRNRPPRLPARQKTRENRLQGAGHRRTLLRRHAASPRPTCSVRKNRGFIAADDRTAAGAPRPGHPRRRLQSQAALEWTVDYAQSQRKMFGQTLADFQNTQFKLAEMKAEITMQQRLRRPLYRAAFANENSPRLTPPCAKLVSTEMQGRVMDQCLQFFGGWGYMTEYPIARAFVDARLGRIGGGSIEVMKQIIASSMMPDNRPARRA